MGAALPGRPAQGGTQDRPLRPSAVGWSQGPVSRPDSGRHRRRHPGRRRQPGAPRNARYRLRRQNLDHHLTNRAHPTSDDTTASQTSPIRTSSPSDPTHRALLHRTASLANHHQPRAATALLQDSPSGAARYWAAGSGHGGAAGSEAHSFSMWARAPVVGR